MSLASWLFDRLIPTPLRANDMEHARAKNTAGFAVVACLAAPPFAAIYAWQHHVSGAWAILLAMAAVTASIGVMRSTGTLLAAHTVATASLYLLFTYLVWSTGGQVGNTITAWWVMVPVAATFIGGLRFGLVWLVLTVCTLLGFVGLNLAGVSFPPNPLADPPLMYTISNLGMVPTIAGLALFFQFSKDQSDRVRAQQVQTIRFLIGEVSAQSNEVSQRVREMVESLGLQGEQAAAMRAASESNNQLALSVEQASEALAQEADVAKQTAMTGADVVGTAIRQAVALAEAIGRADALVHTLQSRSQEISSIADKIKGLAFQTNILALNATIEAAHAGAQGRGFAVVADNVRKLAGEAGEAATAISQELSVVLDHIASTGQLLGESQQLAESSRSSADQAKHSLQSILDSVMALDGETRRLKDASREQLGQNHQLKRYASDMEQRIQQVAGGSGSIKDAMERLTTRLATVQP